MEKKGTGKTVAIVILVLLLLGACGYIVYDKKQTNDKIDSLNSKISSLEKEISQNENAVSDAIDTVTGAVAKIGKVYYGTSTKSDGSIVTQILVLYSGGKFISATTKDSVQGTYTIKDDTLYLESTVDGKKSSSTYNITKTSDGKEMLTAASEDQIDLYILTLS